MFRRNLWITYPVSVAALVVVSLRLIGGAAVWESGREAAANARQAAFLRQKLQLVAAVDILALERDMQWLLTVLPAGPQTAKLLVGVNEAASQAGVAITGFRSQKDQLTISVGATDLAAAGLFIGALEKTLPLVTITQVGYSATGAEVVLEGASRPLPSVTAASSLPLTDPRPQIEKIKAQLTGFKQVESAPLNFEAATGSGLINPFLPAAP